MNVVPRIITKKELRLIVPYCSQHILRLEKRNEFPKRVQIGARRVGWWQHEVLAWLAHRSGKPANVLVREIEAVLQPGEAKVCCRSS